MAIRTVGPSPYAPLKVVHPPRPVTPAEPDAGPLVVTMGIIAVCGAMVGALLSWGLQ